MPDQDPQQSRSALASTWPNPPPFFHSFTETNLERFRALTENQTGDDGAIKRVEGLPEELTHLQPPAVPEDGNWRVFGDQYSLEDALPGLEEQGIQRLGPEQESDSHRDRALELKRLAKSLLLNFLELLGMLSIDPLQAEQKLSDLRTLLINFHHTLNEYRPHQARESTIALMQDHLDRTRAETAAIREAVERTRRVIEGLGSIEVPPVAEAKEAEEEGGEGREVQVWRAADELLA